MGNERVPASEFGSEFLLVFIGYSQDGATVANAVADLERDIQNQPDKFS